MANNVGNSPEYDPSRLVRVMEANRNAMEKDAKDGDVLGGVKILGFGIPNDWVMSGRFRSAEQSAALSEPERYERAMQGVLQALREALNTAHQPFHRYARPLTDVSHPEAGRRPPRPPEAKEHP